MAKWQERVKTLMREQGVTQEQLAGRLGCSQGSIAHWLSGRRTADVEVLEKIATGLGTTGADLLGESDNVDLAPETVGKVPLISWVRAGEWSEVVDMSQPGIAEEWIPAPSKHSYKAFGLRVQGESMEPRFRAGELIIIDPEVTADSGKFVVAKRTGSQEATFKQLVKEGSEVYLKALNPNWPEKIIRIDEEWQICGVVIAKIEVF